MNALRHLGVRGPHPRRGLAAALAAWALALVSAPAQAAMGLAELPGVGGDGPVTMYYPTQAAETPFIKGPFRLSLAQDAEPVRANGRLVVISHGSGGSPWVHADLARTLVEAGFTVALPEHRDDNYKAFTHPGPPSWKLRPAEVSRAIDAVAQSARFGPLLTLDRVGLFGGSAGGHTALSFAGGRWSPAEFRRHCEAHIDEDFSSCVGFTTQLKGNFLDGIKKWVALGVIRQRFDDETWYSYSDPRVRAAVAAVPFAADFDMTSLATPRIPLGLMRAGLDVNQVPRFHIDAVIAACKPCERVVDLPEASHGAMLSPLPPLGPPEGIEARLLGDPPGFDRAQLPAAHRRIADFFRRHLLP